jgi:predicted Zn finger-like uncharacterized protein
VIVRCPNCGTEFGFDDRQVGEGVTVRCSVCKHVFKLESSPAATPAWQIRTTDETSFTAPDVATLREWIAEGRLTPDDQVSRTGRNWMRLGEMPELADLFGLQTGVGHVGVVKPVAPPAPAPQPIAKITPVAKPVAQPVAAAHQHPPLAPATTPSARPLARAVPPASEPVSIGPTSLIASAAPQSQRLTMSPPRSSPVPARAPVARPPDDEDLDVLVDDEVEVDNQLAAIPVEPLPSSRAPSRPYVAAAPAPAPARAAEPVRAAAPARAPAAAPGRVSAPPSRARDDDDFEDDEDDDDDDRLSSSSHSADESFEAPKSRGGLGILAIIGLGSAIVAGVVFGVPQIRERILGGSVEDAPEDGKPGPAVARPEIAAAEAATNSLGTSALAKAEAGLQRAIDAGDADPATQAAMKVALAELLLSRALAYQIAGAIDEARREDFRTRANDDREDGERLIDGLEGFSDVDRLAQVRALERLAAGRAEVEVGPMVPAAASETKLIVRGAVLWQDPAASVPEGLVAGLQALPQHSGLGQATLALALLRAGDTTAARNMAERLMVGVGSDEQVVAQAIRTRLGSEQPPVPEVGETGAAGETEGGQAEGAGSEGGVAKPPPPPGEEGGGSAGGGGGGGGGGNSFERLLDRGCEQVASGDAAGAITTLQRAFNINPKDVDVLVCLADAYTAQGSSHHANQFYERALEQSPNNKGALRGAAKAAAKTGATEKAIGLYERLLKVDPNNAVALAYLANNKPGGAEPTDPGPAPTPAPEGGG